MFPNGKMKALTLSYDDGVEQDRKLVEILNRRGLKAAFNLNSGIQTGAGGWVNKDTGGRDVHIRRMNVRGLAELYAGHEIAVHGLTHPHLENLDEESVRNELEQDKFNLERIFGITVHGMAYPFGTYNDTVVKTLAACGLKYGRGVKSTYSFDVSAEPLVYQPSCHHADPRLMELAERFIKLQPSVPQVFYVWGHSYEFDTAHNWQVIEDFCRLMADRDDIFYATNAQALLGI
ncbi:MAG: polysaccharide deacetylase family protein [Treponema sp.]|jgi:peptidoglycan/xylan/chitin deacetylase (PgdA/CDA1 family)|nr:polysaccharide deacetylase family protein [Treponema sp.]